MVNDIIKFKGEQVDSASFPEKCPVYIICCSKEDNVILNHGVVSSVFFQIRPKLRMLFDVDTGTEGEESQSLVLGMIPEERLRLRNGCPVYMTREIEQDPSSTIDEKGIVLGMHDMPSDAPRTDKEGYEWTFSYSVQILNQSGGTKRIEFGVFPGDLKFRNIEKEQVGHRDEELRIPIKIVKTEIVEVDDKVWRCSEEKKITTEEAQLAEAQLANEKNERFSEVKSNVEIDPTSAKTNPALRVRVRTDEDDDVKKIVLFEIKIKDPIATVYQGNETEKEGNAIGKRIIDLLESDTANDSDVGSSMSISPVKSDDNCAKRHSSHGDVKGRDQRYHEQDGGLYGKGKEKRNPSWMKDEKLRPALSISPSTSADGHDNKHSSCGDVIKDDDQQYREQDGGLYGERQEKRKLSSIEDDKSVATLSPKLSKRKISSASTYLHNSKYQVEVFQRFNRHIVCFAEFVKHLREDIPPSPWGRRMPMCIRWHIKGMCTKDCRLARDHQELSKCNINLLFDWCQRNCDGVEKMVYGPQYAVSSCHHSDRASPRHSSTPRPHCHASDSNYQRRSEYHKESKTKDHNSGPEGSRTVRRNPHFHAQCVSIFTQSKTKVMSIREKISRREIPALPVSRVNGRMCLSWHIKGYCNNGCNSQADHVSYNKAQIQSLIQWCHDNYPLK